jgi:hypothetical protein
VRGGPAQHGHDRRGTAWSYRTAATALESSTVFDTTATQRTIRQQESPGGPDRETEPGFTPLVFDERERLVRWGQDARLRDLRLPESPVLSLP